MTHSRTNLLLRLERRSVLSPLASAITGFFTLTHSASAVTLPAPSPSENGEVLLKSARTWDMDELGEFYQYIPRCVSGDSVPIAVLVHGTPGGSDGASNDAQNGALTYITRSVEWADRNQVILIAPIFDSTNFGSWNDPGSGNYRRLIGKPRGTLSSSEWGPDHFLNSIIDDFSILYDEGQGLPYVVQDTVLLYGHSAGGQFANRYLVKHSERVQACVLSSPRAYVFPNGDAHWGGDPPVLIDTDPNFVWAELRSERRMDWPYGPEQGLGSDPYNWTYQLPSNAFDLAAEVPTIVLTASNPLQEPPGSLHYERAFAWASQMGADWQFYGGGHSSATTQVGHAEPFFEEQPAVAGDRHRHWWVSLL